MSDPREGSVAVAVDLGSTRIKIGGLDREGRLLGLRSAAAPALFGEPRQREGDAARYLAVADRLLHEWPREPGAELSLGIACQRSSFLLWDRETGVPCGPFISWQDTRGSGWCRSHRDRDEEIRRRTGLVFSGHYVGPKLASMLEADALLRARVGSGRLLWGTLDCWWIWRRSGGRLHELDRTMAARTLMFDLDRGDWSDSLLDLYGVPRSLLPRVVATAGRETGFGKDWRLRASVADQAASLLALDDPSREAILVNLGTGAFVFRSGSLDRREGFLAAPVLARQDGRDRYVVEGPINGAGNAVDREVPGPTLLPESDPTPDAFCLPDVAGLGAPHWRADLGWRLSDASRTLAGADRRRVVLEGLIFRLAEVIDGIEDASSPLPIRIAGGLSREPFLARGLASLLGRPIEKMELPEAGLLGTLRLAAGLEPYASPATELVRPAPAGRYLAAKFVRWSSWLASLLERSATDPFEEER